MRMTMILFAGFGLSACAPSEPRSTQFFEANLDEARMIVAGCRDGSVRGGECANADYAVQRAESRERSKGFFGDGKAYTPPDK
ncbi:hypothetical protein BV97_01217 [Novosphingobium resinovorum]|uniref:Lipoprotein n=1 Tax=Novosphingobium resinovorum TaxID=158500 RepID=A0A031K1M2_9SPHN|nr:MULTISPECIES: hypothetical protein [Novosphingobium]EZP83114.1 hypothetical protein BV97_01217 [Novosphingobium resinovorum]